MKSVTFLLVTLILLLGAPLPGTVQAQIPGAITTQSENLNSKIIESWGRQKAFFRAGNFEIIEWKEAEVLLQKGNLRGGKEYHTGWLTIYRLDGKKYLTRPPAPDVFLRFMKEKGLPTEGFAPE